MNLSLLRRKASSSIFSIFRVSSQALVLAPVTLVSAMFAGSAYGQAPATSAPSVEVLVLQPIEVRQWSHFSGRLTPVESVVIKPLVGGTIQQVLFREGDSVTKGQPLFVIDPRPHEAAVKRAKAQLMTAQSQARLSHDELKRSEKLLDSKLLSQSLYDNARTLNQVSEAAILQAESALSEAELNLEYANIVAPINGRVGRAEMTVGNVVQAGVPELTTIVAGDKLYAEFRVSEPVYLQLMRSKTAAKKMPVELTLADDSKAVYRGHLHAFDNHLDASSGTIRARAIFDNKDGVLTPGMFANIALGSASVKPELLVPERAIGTNQSKKFVYVIDSENTVQYREVTLGQQYRGYRIIREGINAGDTVAVNGFTHIRPNMTVQPVTVDVSTELAAD